MSAVLAPFPIFRAFNVAGTAPLSGGLLYTYEAGTTTPLATYTDSIGNVENSNPVVLDATGSANVWLATGVSYKFVLKDSSGVTQWTADEINISPGPFANLDPSAFTAQFAMSGAQLNEAYAGNIASAATVDLSGISGNSGKITGTTGITGFGTVQAGTFFRLYFDDVLTLTHSGSLLLNNGGGNIITAANDRLDLLSLGAGNWVGTLYRASGASLAIASSQLGLSMINGTLTASIGSNALTIALKTLSGTDPSPGDPVKIIFRNSNAATGDYVVRTVTTATSLVVSSGSTLGAVSATPFQLQISASDDAGTVRLGVINLTSGTDIYPFRSGELRTSLAEGGIGAADSAWQLYTNQAVTSKALTVLGYMTWTTGITTAGAWTAGPDAVSLLGPGMTPVGSSVRTVTSSNQTLSNGGLITFTHGLGVTPNPADVSLELVCVITESSWQVGDVVAFPAGHSESGNLGAAVYTSSTQVLVRIGSAGLAYTGKSAGTYFGVTNANWRLRIRVRVYT